jgi:hypothetical protein
VEWEEQELRTRLTTDDRAYIPPDITARKELASATERKEEANGLTE